MKETILQKATEMFLSLGFKSVTMDEIAMELAISKKTIYQHFTTKNDLVDATAIAMFEKISCGVDTICSQGLNSIHEVFEIRNFMTRHFNPENAAAFHQLQKFYPQTARNLRSRQFAKMHGCVTANLIKGIADGLFRQDINVEFVSRIYFTGLTGLKDQEVFPPDQFLPHHITKQFLEYHLRAIVTQMGIDLLNEMLLKDAINI